MRAMEMWRVRPEHHGFEGLQVEQTSGLVGYLVAYPADEKPYLQSGTFDIDAFEEDATAVFFELTKAGYRAAHTILRQQLRLRRAN